MVIATFGKQNKTRKRNANTWKRTVESFVLLNIVEQCLRNTMFEKLVQRNKTKYLESHTIAFNENLPIFCTNDILMKALY